MIKNCFIKSTLFGLREGPQSYFYNYINPPVLDKLEQITKQLYTAGRVRNIINICNFIELLGEEVEDLTKDLTKYIIELYVGPNRNIEINKDESK